MSDESKSRAGTTEADSSASEIVRLKADLEQEKLKCQRYRLAAESATSLIYEWDLGSRVEWLGQVDELLGYQPNELPRTWEGYTSLLHSEDRDHVLAAVEKKLKSEEPYSVESRVRRKDGTYLYWQDRGTIVWDESGKPVKWLGAISDITGRKQAEQEIASLAKFPSENPYPVLRLSRDGIVMYANAASGALLGMWGCAMGGSAPQFWRDLAAQALANRENKTKDIDCDGKVYSMFVTPVAEAGYVNLYARDVTERRRAEEALRESEERITKTFRSMPDALVISRLEDGKIIEVNDSWHKVFGYNREEVIGKNSLALNLFADSADRQRASALLRAQGFVREFEFQIRQKSGALRTAILSVELQEIQGEQYLISVIHDVTESKRAEEALKESENKYRLLAENAHDVIFVLDMNLKYTYVSPSVKILRGYEAEEVLRQTPIETLTPSSRDLAMRTLSEILEMEKSGRTDIPIFPTLQLEIGRKDGTTVWTEVKFSFIRDENQRPVGILGVTRDITERKLEIERVREALGATVQAIAMTVETRDPYTAGHQRRVADLACAIAMEMRLPADQVEGIGLAAAIHDLGKISVPAEMLSKPTKLTAIEFSLIKSHSQFGYEILKNINFPWPVARIVLEHHERMNGSGYPNGLTGDKLLLESRILSVADVVEAMASHRPYRASLGIEAALNEISKNNGILYDADVTDACLRLFREKAYKIID